MQERVQRGRDADRTEADTQDAVASAGQAERMKSDLDDLIEQIDDVLEENAEEFVRNYVQKGGE
ncbi:MAG: ubiquitin-like protein Pup [Acidimicrobiales bacterium]